LLTILFHSCNSDAAPAPKSPTESLVAARHKVRTAGSFAYDVISTFRNLADKDTSVYTYRAQYLAGGHENFPWDFVYEDEDFGVTFVLDSGQYYMIEREARRVIVRDSIMAIEDLHANGAVFASQTPYYILSDSSWNYEHTKEVKEQEMLVFQSFELDTTPIARTPREIVRRIYLDPQSDILRRWEEVISVGEEVTQSVTVDFENQRWNSLKKLEVPSVPLGYLTLTMRELAEAEGRAPLEPGDKFPDVNLVDVYGQPITSKGLQGKKSVFIFSFIGCGDCEYTRRQLAKMNFKLSEDYQGFYLNPTDAALDIISYHESKPWPFQLVSVDFEFANACGVQGYSTSLAVDENGIVEEVQAGYDEAFWRSMME